jgi:hypothetical protein
MQLRDLVDGGAVVGHRHTAVYGTAARARKGRLSRRDGLLA